MLSRRRHAGEVWQGESRCAGSSWGREGKAARRRKWEAVGRDRRHSIGAGRERRHAATTRRRRETLRELSGGSSRHAWEGRRDTTRESKRRECVAGLVLKKHRVCVGLALGGVGRGDGVNDGLGLFVADLLVVVYDVAQVVSAAVVCLAH